MRGKCLCIKNYMSHPGRQNYCEFVKDSWYEYTDQQFVTREYPEGFNVKFYKSNYIFFRNHQDPKAEKGYSLFNTYFKTLKDIRKEKLNKINETNG